MFVVIRNILKPTVIPLPFRCIFTKSSIKAVKGKVKNKEERLRELEMNQKRKSFDALMSALGNRNVLSVDEWKAFLSRAKINRVPCSDQDIFTAIKTLDKSKDPLENAENYIKALNMERNVIVNCLFIDLYAAKSAQSGLSESEEQKLIELYAFLSLNFSGFDLNRSIFISGAMN